MPFVRHCVECPKCLTRFLIGFSPYRNGSCVVRNAPGSRAEYVLYCSCRTPFLPSPWQADEVKSYEVLKTAHDRGYGTPGEIVQTGCQLTMSYAARHGGISPLDSCRSRRTFEMNTCWPSSFLDLPSREPTRRLRRQIKDYLSYA